MKKTTTLIAIVLALAIAFSAGAMVGGPFRDRRSRVTQIRLDNGKPAVFIELCPDWTPTIDSCFFVRTTSPEKLGVTVARWHKPWLDGEVER